MKRQFRFTIPMVTAAATWLLTFAISSNAYADTNEHHGRDDGGRAVRLHLSEMQFSRAA